MIILDKQGKRVTVNCRIAIAEVGLNDNCSYVPKMSFATVVTINKNSLSIKYDDYSIDNEFISKEFVIILGQVISLEDSLKQELYKVGVVNV